jgi:hypothetical protein
MKTPKPETDQKQANSTDFSSNQPAGSSNQTDNKPIKIDCGKENYACGNKCYPFFKLNGYNVQYRCDNNVLDKSKFSVNLCTDFDSIEEMAHFFETFPKKSLKNRKLANVHFLPLPIEKKSDSSN